MEASPKATRAVRVCVRVRPLSSQEAERGDQELLDFEKEARRVVLKVKNGSNRQRSAKESRRAFLVDDCYEGTASSERIHMSFVNDTVDRFLQGYNGTVIAYGQTGSGKTYTMFGGVAPDMSTDKGIVRHVCEQVFQQVSTESSLQQTHLSVSALEVYNEQLFDLSLRERTKQLSLIQQQHAVREGRRETRTAVLGLREHSVQSAEELLKFIEKCTKRRTTAETQMNHRSSRSHVVFSLLLKRASPKSSTDGSEVTEWTVSKLRLVDLAGSERNKRSGAIGKNFEEAKHINSGLLALGNVINALSEETLGDSSAKPKFVSYRDSKLTRLLQDSLEGNSLTSFIACVRASERDLEETVNTLTYACRARKIQTFSTRTVVETRAQIETKGREALFDNGPAQDLVLCRN